MKTLNIVVKGHYTDYQTNERKPFEITLKAYECENSSCYGSGKYVLIKRIKENGNEEEIGYYDCRYITNYSFDFAVKLFIDNYYGKNAEEVNIQE